VSKTIPRVRPDRFFSRSACVLAMLCLLAPPLATAGSILLGQGASINTGSGQVDLGCGDADIAGALSGRLVGARNLAFGPGASVAGASLSLSGDWVNQGPRALDAQVTWRDGCGVAVSNMLGNSDLNALDIASNAGREIRFDAAGEQYIRHSLSLTGAPGQLLRLRSTSPVLFANVTLEFGGSQLIDWVDVDRIDSRAGQGIAPGLPADYNSQLSGNAFNWFGLAPIPVSSLGLTSTLLLIFLIGLLGLFLQYTKSSNTRGVNIR
jgi:hypothetical protein